MLGPRPEKKKRRQPPSYSATPPCSRSIVATPPSYIASLNRDQPAPPTYHKILSSQDMIHLDLNSTPTQTPLSGCNNSLITDSTVASPSAPPQPFEDNEQDHQDGYRIKLDAYLYEKESSTTLNYYDLNTKQSNPHRETILHSISLSTQVHSPQLTLTEIDQEFSTEHSTTIHLTHQETTSVTPSTTLRNHFDPDIVDPTPSSLPSRNEIPSFLRDARLWTGISMIIPLLLTWLVALSLALAPHPLPNPRSSINTQVKPYISVFFTFIAFCLAIVNTCIIIPLLISPCIPITKREYHGQKNKYNNTWLKTARFTFTSRRVIQTVFTVIISLTLVTHIAICGLSGLALYEYAKNRAPLRHKFDIWESIFHNLNPTYHYSLPPHSPYSFSIPPIFSVILCILSFITLCPAILALFQTIRGTLVLNKQHQLEQQHVVNEDDSLLIEPPPN